MNSISNSLWKLIFAFLLGAWPSVSPDGDFPAPWTVELFMVVVYHDWPPKKNLYLSILGLLAKIKCKNVYSFMLR